MRFLIVDEHPLLSEAIEGVLRRQFPSAEISAVESQEQAFAALHRQRTDVTVTDLLCCSAKDLDGLPALTAAAAPGRVVVFGKCSGSADAQRAHAAGVGGYVPASHRPELIAAAIGLVLAGGSYFPQLSRLDQPPPAANDRVRIRHLSTRQREVLRHLQVGDSNKLIARALGISIATVKLHVQAILRVTGTHTRGQAAAFANDHPDLALE